MRRALLVSILFHVVVLSSMFELRLLPSYSVPFWSGGLPLSVDLASSNSLGAVGLAQQREVQPVIATKEGWLEPKVRTTSADGRRKSKEAPKNDPRIERDFLPSIARSEQITGLSPDAESEYRINLAREVRRMGFQFEPGKGGGREGSVHMVISYRVGMSVPTVLLDRSSGHAGLDEMAMHSLSGALAKVPLPGLATGMNFRMSFVLEYSLPR